MSTARPAEATLDPALQRITLRGDWLLEAERPRAADVVAQIEAQGLQRLAYDAQGLGAWDTGLVTFLVAM